MLTPQQYNVREAVELIRDGDTIATIGMTMMGIAEAVFKEIERSFLEKGCPVSYTHLDVYKRQS